MIPCKEREKAEHLHDLGAPSCSTILAHTWEPQGGTGQPISPRSSADWPSCSQERVRLDEETSHTGQKHCQARQQSERAATPPSSKCYHTSLPPSSALLITPCHFPQS
ncbi:hypothetical protein Q8A73_021859 [Channa argus]|nr:hypothetical protein Q8A73_021859 [Channa argus]